MAPRQYLKLDSAMQRNIPVLYACHSDCYCNKLLIRFDDAMQEYAHNYVSNKYETVASPKQHTLLLCVQSRFFFTKHCTVSLIFSKHFHH